MSKLFYDHLIVLKGIEEHIKKAETYEEREELWQLVDELIHHTVIGCILDTLPKNHHHEFLERFCLSPYDDGLIDFINERSKEDIGKLIIVRLERLSRELLLLMGK